MKDMYTRLKRRVRERMPNLDCIITASCNPDAKKAVLRAAREIIWEEGFVINPAQMQEMLDGLVDEIFGLGPLEPLLRDDDITEIMVNGPERVFIEREGRIIPSRITLDGEEEVHRIIDRIIGPLGLRVDEASPYVDARLPSGSRVNVVLPPLSLLGPVITIRKFRPQPYDLQELVASQTLSADEASFLSREVRERKNLVLCGGAGSGKTTLLNALSSHIGREERIITLEDAAELRLQQPHVIPLETRPPNLEGRGAITLRELLRNALRMRPDRIIIGEIRGPEALDLLQALNTGHRGSITTVHANSPFDAISRLETMALTAAVGLPSRAIREQIARAVDTLVYMERNAAGKRKVGGISVMDRINDGPPRLLAAFGAGGSSSTAEAITETCISHIPIDRFSKGVNKAAVAEAP